VGNGIRLLVVDDHAIFAESVARLLDHEPDFEVVGVAGTVARAAELAGALTPDVALVDLRLPDGDGASATRAVRTASPATRVLILTGAGDHKLLDAAIEAGSSGSLTKDRALDDLVAAVRAVYASS
jgi:DNA-binding NarL/FixJ family response regulator